MRKTLSVLAAGSLLMLLAGGIAQRPAHSQPAADKDREGDRDQIRKSSYDFVQAYEKGDAKAIAALWTEQGEYHDDSGHVLQGRAAIEKAYAAHFKEKPGEKIEVEVRSIRFPSKDSAIEDGILRSTPAGAELPTATRYSALHVREDGKWKIASVSESGAAEDKLDDIAWLIGNWTTKGKDKEMQMTFEWNAKKTQIRSHYSVKADGKLVASGLQIIAQDPQTGQIRSWHFDDDGGHGQSMWFRDGNRWAMESLGVRADGRETGAANILTRLNDNEAVWRSTHRMVGGAKAPDTEPVKIVRTKSGK